MLGMHREDSKTSMCILKLDNQVSKLDQEAKKSLMGQIAAETSKTSPCFPYTECSILQLHDREWKHVKWLLQSESGFQRI